MRGAHVAGGQVKGLAPGSQVLDKLQTKLPQEQVRYLQVSIGEAGDLLDGVALRLLTCMVGFNGAFSPGA